MSSWEIQEIQSLKYDLKLTHKRCEKIEETNRQLSKLVEELEQRIVELNSKTLRSKKDKKDDNKE